MKPFIFWTFVVVEVLWAAVGAKMILGFIVYAYRALPVKDRAGESSRWPLQTSYCEITDSAEGRQFHRRLAKWLAIELFIVLTMAAAITAIHAASPK
ncbi:MAG: hypothetical protein AAB426_14225 [Myxococcota bacterium]